ncbi:MAG: Transmembrane emp24 domain-containing protein 3 [Alyxoria varia]|nr:MAG: Transmembrane emp24 domain-containing protein 3 [Alyxoria varia]
MQLLVAMLGLLGLFTSLVNATALTYRFQPNEKACFFAHNKEQGAKVAFYFAVQSGGSFDIDYRVTAPSKKIIVDGSKERQGDFVFTGNEVGEYSFCFDNEMSTVTDKTVDFEIAIEHEARAQLPSRQGAPAEQTSVVSESIYKLSGQLSTITRNQKYFRTRENRNFSTVRSTEQRIYRFSIMEGLAMVAMGALQVFVVRFFFTGARKGRSQEGLEETLISFFLPDRTTIILIIANTVFQAVYYVVSVVVQAWFRYRGLVFDEAYLKALIIALLAGVIGYVVTGEYDNNLIVSLTMHWVAGWVACISEVLEPLTAQAIEFGIRFMGWVGRFIEWGIDRLAGGPD